MITLLHNLRKSEKGISVLELLIYIVVAAALALAAWIGLSSLMDSGDKGAAEQNVASAYKVAKGNCLEAGYTNWADCTAATISTAIGSEGLDVITTPAASTDVKVAVAGSGNTSTLDIDGAHGVQGNAVTFNQTPTITK